MKSTQKRRRPVEAIEQRISRSAECEQRVRRALTKLAKTGAPFTVENVCDLAGVGKTFIYDKRRPELTRAVLAARDISQNAIAKRADEKLDNETASWRERALNAETLAKTLRATVRERDARINDFTGQLYDPEGNHLAERNAELRQLVSTLNENLRNAEMENGKLRRSLHAARANIKHERDRNVTMIGHISP
jgi:protein-disulfide isomerase-like protein with CxxC motif